MHNAAWPLCASDETFRNPQARWDATVGYVETIRDALGKPIDAGIKSLVIALNAFGFPTVSSCEGHLDWGVPAPWVEIGPAPTRKGDALRRELEDKQENEFSVRNGFRILSVYTTSAGDRLYVITEADRSVTTILLPEEY